MASEQGNLGAWYLYIVRTSTIAKNRHLNIVLQAELFLRTGTYDRPKGVGKYSESSETSRSKNPYPWRSTPISVWPAPSYQRQYGRRDRVGERFLNPLPDEASRTKREPEKKDPLRGSFFSYRPSAGAAPRSVPTQQTVYVVAPTLQLLTIP